MFRSLSARLTFSYAVTVFTLLIVVAAVVTRLVAGMYAHGATEALDRGANEVRRVVHGSRHAYFFQLADRVKHDVVERGFHIRALARTTKDPNVTHLSGDKPTYIREVPPDRTFAQRLLITVAASLGLQPKRVPVEGGVFVVVTDIDALGSAVTTYGIALLAFLAMGLIAAYFLGRYVTALALAPLVAVTGALRQFASGDFTPRPIESRDRSEIGDLASAYNGAARQVALALDERRRVEDYMRQFVADAAHELRTPLTVILGYLQVLQRGALENPAITTRAFATLDAESRRMKALIDRLIVLARLERPQPSEPVAVNVAAMARRIATAVEAMPDAPPIALRIETDAPVRAEESELEESLANLVDNARKYGDGTPIELTIRQAADRVVIEVSDGGPGIPEDERAHIFERFYRGERRGEIEGSGLGLAIAQQAATRAGGALRLAAANPGRTTFELTLPALREAAREPVTI